MSPQDNIIDAMIEMINFFIPKCDEISTLLKIKDFSENKELWKNADDLFSEIRDKTLETEVTKNRKLEAQYLFEEACAKTLYNFYCYSYGEDGSFRPESPFWILPLAIQFGKEIGEKDLSQISSLLKI